MGAEEVERGEDILNRANIPTFKYPDRAARAFYYMWRYSYNLRALYETPSAGGNGVDVVARRTHAEELLQRVRQSGRTLLTEYESKKILAAYDIPTVETHVARSVNEAVKIAEKIGYPVVLKLHSETITHKTDVGGVQLNLRNATAVKQAWKAIETSVAKAIAASPAAHASYSTPAFQGVTVQPMVKVEGYELILGSSVDPQFGPVLLFGAGGQLVEVNQDRSLGLPPLNATLARRMMERTKIYTALKGVRGRQPINLEALEHLLVRFSQLVADQPWISEIDINPLMASPEALIALDARIVVHGRDVRAEDVSHPAIRPYPTQYVTRWKLDNGRTLTLRPIRPEDEPMMVAFHETLSEESVYYRYFSPLKLPQRIAHERLTRICFNDYDREIALVADHKNPKTGKHEILGVGRLSKVHGSSDGEFALLVSDEWHDLGLGTELLKSLIKIGRAEKLQRITGYILPENHAMQHVCRNLGFEVRHDIEAGEFHAALAL
jgi:acetyltransferase